MKRHLRPFSQAWLLPALILLAAALLAPAAQADDTDLFRESTAAPYVFFLLDVSGSMNQSIPCSEAQALAGSCGYPACSQDEIDNGLCDSLCPEGACLPRMVGDDPMSRLRTAKEAIYEIARQVDDIQFGFGHFGRNNGRIRDKHWWYRPLAEQPDSYSGGNVGFVQLRSDRLFPSPSYDDIRGHEDVFGETAWNCESFGKDGGRTHQCEADGYDCDLDQEVGCYASSPAKLSDPWEYEKIRRIPKLDDDISDDVHYYIEDTDGTVYRVQYEIVTSLSSSEAAQLGVSTEPELGDARVPVRLDIDCQSAESNCSGFSNIESMVVFEKVDEMVYWEPGEGVRRDPPGESWFGSGSPRRASVSNVNGLERNNDESNDTTNGVNLLAETLADPDDRGGAYSVGDLIPFDWNRNRTFEIRARMAPNHLLPLQSDRPDFQVATYLEDHDSNSALSPKDPGDYLLARGELAAHALYQALPSARQDLIQSFFKPIFPRSGTPTGSAVDQFQDWLEDWLDVATSSGGDPNIDCRDIYLVVLTDGLASDGTTACDRAADLRSVTVNGQEFDIRTFGVAFGRFEGDFVEEEAVTGRANMLKCIADEGGTDTDDDLDGDGFDDGPGVLYPQNKQELVDRLLEVIQLLRPEPRTLTGVAVPSVQADVADKVFLTDFTPLNSRPIWPGKVHAFLKPLPLDEKNRPDFEPCSDLPDGESESSCYLYDLGERLKAQIPTSGEVVGEASSQRRIYYSVFQGLGDNEHQEVPRERRLLTLVDEDTEARIENDLLRGFDLDSGETDALNAVLKEVPAIRSATLPDGTNVTYALGDVFHADPLLVGTPPNSAYWQQDAGPAADDDRRDLSCADGDPGYRCFLSKHLTRRRTLFVSSNDGMLHAFDVGGWDSDENTFDNGSGKEMFAYMPRPVMSTLRRMFESNRHDFTVDGQLTAGDAFIDPDHGPQGFGPSSPPDADERLWRTVIMGSLRRGAGTPRDFELPALPTVLPADAEEREDLLALLDSQEVSGYFALDITQPDALNLDSAEEDGGFIASVPSQRQPGCAGTGTGGSLPSGCEGPAYGTPLWEFNDSFNGILLDEDGDSLADLAPTWSKANMGRMRVCTADCDSDDPTLEDRYVAVFGGGLDPERPERGHWLYVVDVETGVAIYKHPLDGAVPAQPAAVDIDLDGYLDRIYVGTTEGFVYRSDLKEATVDGYVYPPLETVSEAIEVEGRDMTVEWQPKRITDPRFAPAKIFDVNADDLDVRGIFYRTTVFYVPSVNQYALAFGTGNREDIFETNEPTGRFFTFVDDIGDPTELEDPFGPSDLTSVDPGSAANALGTTDLLVEPPSGFQGGWWLDLELGERLITEPFALSGLLVYSTYKPTGVNPNANLCTLTGQSRIYAVASRNANGFMVDDGARIRYRTLDEFVTSPFAEQSATQNPARSDSGSQATADRLNSDLEEIMEELKANFPPNCRFSDTYRQDLKARSSDTGMIFIAPVPICIIEKDYREGTF